MCQSARQAIINSVHHFIDKANDIYNLSMSYPTIRFTQRGMTGGSAKARLWEVNFNEALMVDNLSEYVNQTAPHEVAHLVCYRLNGNEFEYRFTKTGKRQRISHGERFYSIMRDFGVEEKTTHSMDVSKVRQKRRPAPKYAVKCSCGWTGMVGTTRAKRMLRGTTDYFHSRSCPPIQLV